MSTRWMAVQYVGDTLRLPIVNKSDMDKPFGSSELEREVRRIVVNPFSDSPQTFVPEAENAKLRELCADLYAEMLTYSTAPNYNASVWSVKLRELGVKVGRWTHDGIKYNDSAPYVGRARG